MLAEKTGEPSRQNRTGPIRLLQLSDCHLLSRPGAPFMGVDTGQSLRDTLEAARCDSDWPPDLTLLTGDLVQDVETAAYERLLECLSNLPRPVYCLPGNHDDPVRMADVLAPAGIPFQSRILLEGWQILCLDSRIPGSPRGRLAPGQLEQLSRHLEENPQMPALVSLHHHPLPCGSPWLDTMVLENAGEFFAVLERHPQVGAVIFGHIHQEMDCRHGGLRLLAAPSTCFQFKPDQAVFALDEQPPGYRWLELHPDGRIETRTGRSSRLPSGLNLGSAGY